MYATLVELYLQLCLSVQSYLCIFHTFSIIFDVASIGEYPFYQSLFSTYCFLKMLYF